MSARLIRKLPSSRRKTSDKAYIALSLRFLSSRKTHPQIETMQMLLAWLSDLSGLG